MKFENQSKTEHLNVNGENLEICSCNPMTGWFRDGYCCFDSNDTGNHTVCCVMDNNFLNYSKAQGNDLTTPMPLYSFPGLKEGDHWCICLERWKQALLDGLAPKVILESTNISVLQSIPLQVLIENKHISNN